MHTHIRSSELASQSFLSRLTALNLRQTSQGNKMEDERELAKFYKQGPRLHRRADVPHIVFLQGIVSSL